MSVCFAGIELKNHLVAASSPLTESLDRLRRCSAAGFGAAILKSTADYSRNDNGYGRKVVYCKDGYYADSSYEREIFTLEEGLDLYRKARFLVTDMLLIPSVSANSLDPAEWLKICHTFIHEGALLLQLDFFYLGILEHDDGFYSQIRHLLRTLTNELSCPIMPKLNSLLNPEQICALLKECNIKYVSLLDSIREAPPSGYGLHKNTTSYFGKRQFPVTRRYLAIAKAFGLEVCAGGGATSKADMELLVSDGADLVQTASYILTRNFSAVKDLLDEPHIISEDMESFLNYNPWCDVQNNGICDKCGGCQKIYSLQP